MGLLDRSKKLLHSGSTPGKPPEKKSRKDSLRRDKRDRIASSEEQDEEASDESAPASRPRSPVPGNRDNFRISHKAHSLISRSSPFAHNLRTLHNAERFLAAGEYDLALDIYQSLANRIPSRSIREKLEQNIEDIQEFLDKRQEEAAKNPAPANPVIVIGNIAPSPVATSPAQGGMPAAGGNASVVVVVQGGGPAGTPAQSGAPGTPQLPPGGMQFGGSVVYAPANPQPYGTGMPQPGNYPYPSPPPPPGGATTFGAGLASMGTNYAPPSPDAGYSVLTPGPPEGFGRDQKPENFNVREIAQAFFDIQKAVFEGKNLQLSAGSVTMQGAGETAGRQESPPEAGSSGSQPGALPGTPAAPDPPGGVLESGSVGALGGSGSSGGSGAGGDSDSESGQESEKVQEIRGVLELKPPDEEDTPFLTLTYDFNRIPHAFALSADHNILEYAYYKYKPMLVKAQQFIRRKQITKALNYYRVIREQQIPSEFRRMIDRNIRDITEYLQKYLMNRQ